MQYNPETKTITINRNTNLYNETIEYLNNMPEDAEILNIDSVRLNNTSINNLPSTLKEINIKISEFWWDKNNYNNNTKYLILPLSYFSPKEIKEELKLIFPKRPYGCKIYLID